MDVIGKFFCAFVGGFRQYYGELLATVAGCRVLSLDAFVQCVRYETDHLVANNVAVGVVDSFEMVDVQHDQADRRRVVVGGSDCRIQ